MSGFVYAIDNGRGRVKIGWANAPERRLAELRVADPDGLTLLGYARGHKGHEAEIHALLAPWRECGEWFRKTGPVVAFIEMLPRHEKRVRFSVPARNPRVSEIVAALGGLAAFSEAIGVQYGTAKKMQARGSINARHWPAVINAGRDAGFSISADQLAQIHQTGAA